MLDEAGKNRVALGVQCNLILELTNRHSYQHQEDHETDDGQLVQY